MFSPDSTTEAICRLTILPAAAYFIGSAPFGVMIATLKGVDLRSVGSGNVGATNVARALGMKYGILCFLMDVLKGFLPTLVAGYIVGSFDSGVPPGAADQAVWLAVGCGCILGHVFSIYLRGRGGKGVATSLGVVLGVYPYLTFPALAAFGVWFGVTFLSRYVSLGSIIAALSFMPFFVAANAIRDGMCASRRLWPMACFVLAMVMLIIFKHRANIRRLLSGEEHKIGERDTSTDTADGS